MTISQSVILSLLQKGYITVGVTYNLFDDETRPTLDKKLYTFKTVLSLIPGDLVVVPNAVNYKVCKVMRVDETPDIDINADFEYKWVVSKLDTTEYESVIEAEKQGLMQLEQAQKAKIAKDAMDTIAADYGKAIAGLSFVVTPLPNSSSAMPEVPPFPEAPKIEGSIATSEDYNDDVPL